MVEEALGLKVAIVSRGRNQTALDRARYQLEERGTDIDGDKEARGSHRAHWMLGPAGAPAWVSTRISPGKMQLAQNASGTPRKLEFSTCKSRADWLLRKHRHGSMENFSRETGIGGHRHRPLDRADRDGETSRRYRPQGRSDTLTL